MIPVFGILLYPVVFLVLYAVCEVIFPTRNTAMIVSLLAAFPCCLTYVRLRTRFAARAKAKKAARQSAQERLYGLMLLDKSAFEALFPD
ncbi:MAG: hypothetical protein J6X30_05180, partial [Clostridia bacterium]|nr:hypothetical protein [Clostridia bacterium]